MKLQILMATSLPDEWRGRENKVQIETQRIIDSYFKVKQDITLQQILEEGFHDIPAVNQIFNIQSPWNLTFIGVNQNQQQVPWEQIKDIPIDQLANQFRGLKIVGVRGAGESIPNPISSAISKGSETGPVASNPMNNYSPPAFPMPLSSIDNQGSMMTLSELGKTLKCDRCQNFAKISRQDVGEKTVTLDFACEKCGNKYQRKYSLNQYIRVAQAGLIDPPEIIDFQKKMIIIKGELPRIDKGMDGAFIIDQSKRNIIEAFGKALICKCNKFYAITIKNFKKDKVELQQYCAKCTPKGRLVPVGVRQMMLAGNAGLIDQPIMAQVREEYSGKGDFDTKQSYTSQDGTLATWVQEELGMAGDGANKSKKCYICGSSVGEGVSRCPKCGSDL